MPDFPTQSNQLVEYLRDHPNGDSFPDTRVNYYNRFVAVDEYLNINVHNFVNQGASTHDQQYACFLTDHGPDHIATVMRRASELLVSRDALNPYEVYLLLLATHLHDTGNVFGRDEHERKIQTAITDLGNTLGDDDFEKRLIRDIATAHGGYVGADRANKDTIGTLRYGDVERKVRPKLLAAILRFADELADDYTRTSRFLLDASVVPEGSEVYHHYADRLRDVNVDPTSRQVSLYFEVGLSLLTQKKRKAVRDEAGNWEIQDTYLIDEIKARCLKMHKEQVYCARFMSSFAPVDQITVKIDACGPGADPQFTSEYSTVIDTWYFTLRQAGYPGHIATLKEVSPEFNELNGDILSHRFSVGDGDVSKENKS